ncbi:MAG: hypothetical protein J5643_07335 [Lachnospiraceae bacterium]|nr:hypothetical protein [Lachnospiraceae bacterium]
MTLHDLTGQESGIVIYSNGDTIVCNWSNVCPDENELPKLFYGEPIGWDAGAIIPIEDYRVDDWVGEARRFKILRGITVLYDANGDLICPDEGSAHIYRLDDETIIIAPEDWN